MTDGQGTERELRNKKRLLDANNSESDEEIPVRRKAESETAAEPEMIAKQPETEVETEVKPTYNLCSPNYK